MITIATIIAMFASFSADGNKTFIWPVGETENLHAHDGPCVDWPGAPDGCIWLSLDSESPTVWVDKNPFQRRESKYGYHLGADLGLGGDLDKGLPVRSIADGEIILVEEDIKSWGNLVFIRHDMVGGPIVALYAHVDWSPSGKPELGPVKRGAPIAVIGDGFWTDCTSQIPEECKWPYHLHFEIRETQEAVIGGGYTPFQLEENQRGPDDQIDPIKFMTGFRPLARVFSALCSAQENLPADIACPFEEDNQCIGERCQKSGTVTFTASVPLYENPRMDNIVEIVKPDERRAFVTTKSFSVPCPGRVTKSYASENPTINSPDLIKLDEDVYRLSYSGEGTYRYLAGNRIKNSAVGDEVTYTSQCTDSWEIWFGFPLESGEIGWAWGSHIGSRTIQQ